MRNYMRLMWRCAGPGALSFLLAIGVAGLAGPLASAQTQTPEPAPGSASAPVAAPNDHDITHHELNNFDDYLDKHPGVHRQLTKDPSLINNPQYLAQHPHLQNFLNNHPGVKEESGENPGQFMHRENQFLRRGGDVSRGEAARADRYFDQHPGLARQLNRNPKLVDNPEFMEKHPGFQKFLQRHPEVKSDMKQNPYAFRHREHQYEHHEGERAERARPMPRR